MLGRDYVHHLHPVREEKYGSLFIKTLLLLHPTNENKGEVWWVPDIVHISSKAGVARIAMAK